MRMALTDTVLSYIRAVYRMGKSQPSADFNVFIRAAVGFKNFNCDFNFLNISAVPQTVSQTSL